MHVECIWLLHGNTLNFASASAFSVLSRVTMSSRLLTLVNEAIRWPSASLAKLQGGGLPIHAHGAGCVGRGDCRKASWRTFVRPPTAPGHGRTSAVRSAGRRAGRGEQGCSRGARSTSYLAKRSSVSFTFTSSILTRLSRYVITSRSARPCKGVHRRTTVRRTQAQAGYNQ